MSDGKEPTRAERYRAQIETWANRAAMAQRQGNSELAQQALRRKRDYQNALARYQEFNVENQSDDRSSDWSI